MNDRPPGTFVGTSEDASLGSNRGANVLIGIGEVGNIPILLFRVSSDVGAMASQLPSHAFEAKSRRDWSMV